MSAQAEEDLEVWRVVALNMDYLVSSHGRVERVGGRVLSPNQTSRGYLKVALGRACQVYVHALVCEAFHGPRPPGHHVDHIDFDRTNNHFTNLRWLPAAENRVRWAGKTSDWRNIWATPDEVPEGEDDSPMTETELAELAETLRSNGW